MWLESEGDKVDELVLDLFGEKTTRDVVAVGVVADCPYNEEQVME